MSTALIETAIAGTTTTIIATATNVEPLWTALIGFGTALVTVVGGELIKYLVAFFKKKTDDLSNKDTDEEDKEVK